MAYLHPGVYVEEVPSSVRTIEGASTSTAAFVGVAEKGPTDVATRITSWSQFVTRYGSFIQDADLAYSVFSFFANGGTSCYVVRVTHGDALFSHAMLKRADGNDSVKVKAASPGGWGNRLSIEITDGNNDPFHGFNLAVYEGEVQIESYEDLSMTDDDPDYVVKRINGVSPYISVEDHGAPDNAIFVSQKDLQDGANLSQVYNVKIRIDGQEQLINLREGIGQGSYPSVPPEHIRDRINAGFLDTLGVEVAVVDAVEGRKYIRLQSPTSGTGSSIGFTPPGQFDATEDVFGLVEYSWQIKGGGDEETYVEARGEIDLSTLSSLTKLELKVRLDDIESTVDFAGVSSVSLENITNQINADLSERMATTDGKYLILRSSNYRAISFIGDPQTNDAVEELFGSAGQFYGYLAVGVVDDEAQVVSDVNPADVVSGAKRWMRIKVDNHPTIDIDLADGFDFDAGQITLDHIVKAINRQVKTKTSISEDIASAVHDQTDKLKLRSPTTGSSSRLVLYRARKDDGRTPVVVGSDPTPEIFTSLSGRTFVAETYPAQRASVTGSVDLTTPPSNLADSKLRVAVSGVDGGQSKEVAFPSGLSGTAFDWVQSITNELGRDVGTLALDTENSIYLILSSLTRGSDAFLRFSIPLGNSGGVHGGPTNAMEPLFGSAIPNGAKVSPDYEFVFDVGIRRPANTLKPAGLKGGFHDHRRVNNGDIFGVTTILDRQDHPIFGGVSLLDKIDDMSLLAIPCVPPAATNIDHKALIGGGMSYCDNRKDCFFIADIPHDRQTPEQAKAFAREELTASKGRDYAALYYPWVKVVDPIGTTEPTRLVPPSGHVAGLFARIDSARGVWKAPAGTEAGLANANSVAFKLADVDQDILNPIGVNCIRQFPGTGIVSWGARTLGIKTKPEWKYVPIRRTAIMLRTSIYNGIQWAVFEPNDSRLWSSLRLNIEAFMNSLFRAGAFQGETPAQAYFVRCGLGDTMTQAEIDAGKVIVLVGFAPLKPAEFVIVRIEQKVGQQ